MMERVAGRVTAKFRYNAALAIAGFVALCGAVPLAASRWYLAFVLLVPLAVLIWGWRAGVDVRDHTLVVRWGIGGRRIPAASIVGFALTRRGVHAVLADDRTVWLPAVPGPRVPVLAEAIGLKLAAPTPQTQPADAPSETASQATD